MAGSMAASGHRMFVGQSLTLGISAIYDDGEPAADASVQVFLNGVAYSQKRRFHLSIPHGLAWNRGW